MMHISTMIEKANEAVTDAKAAYMKACMSIAARQDLTLEQKQAIIELIAPIDAAITVAINKFSYDCQ